MHEKALLGSHVTAARALTPVFRAGWPHFAQNSPTSPRPAGEPSTAPIPRRKALVPLKRADYREFQMAVFVSCQSGLHHSPKSRFVSATMA